MILRMPGLKPLIRTQQVGSWNLKSSFKSILKQSVSKASCYFNLGFGRFQVALDSHCVLHHFTPINVSYLPIFGCYQSIPDATRAKPLPSNRFFRHSFRFIEVCLGVNQDLLWIHAIPASNDGIHFPSKR